MKKLGILSSFRSGLQLSRAQNQNGNESFEYKVIKISDFTPSGTLNVENGEKITFANPIPESHLTQEGDVLVRLKAPLSAAYINKKSAGAVFSSVMAVIQTDMNQLLPQYLTYYLNSSIPQGYLQERSSNGTMMSFLRLSDLKELELHLPSLEQQRQIVQFIQESDKKITLLQEKIHAEISLRNERFKQFLTQGSKQ